MKMQKRLSLLLAVVMILSSFPLGVFAESYIVQDGDILWKIAQMYGMDYSTLAENNNITNPNMIHPGDTLEVSGEKAKPTGKSDVKVNIYGTADLHGRIYSYEYAGDYVDKDAGMTKIQTIVKRERAANPNSLLMDCGDTIQDNSAELFNDLPVHPMVQAMNEMDYDV